MSEVCAGNNNQKGFSENEPKKSFVGSRRGKRGSRRNIHQSEDPIQLSDMSENGKKAKTKDPVEMIFNNNPEFESVDKSK